MRGYHPKKRKLVCKDCGHEMGWMRFKRWRFGARVVILSFLAVVGSEIIAGIIERWILG